MSNIAQAEKYAAYPEYKYSAVDWIDKLPAHWGESKLRYMFSFGKGLTITKANLQDKGIPCVNYGEVHSKFGFEVNPEIHVLKCVSENYLKTDLNALLNKGDIVFADTSEDIEGSGNFTQLVSDEDVFAGYHTIIARPNERQCSRFYAYLLESLELRTQIRHAVKGVKVFSVTQAILRGINIWLPSLNEREKIANFLDHESAKIDTLIEKQQQLIKLLKEKRQAVISHAVTKGLNPNVPVRDSGVEWLGEVPEHWAMPKISQLGRVLNGSTPDKTNLSYWEGGTIPWLASGCLNSEIINEPSLLISEGAYQNSSVELIPANSLLVGMVGQGKTRGTSAILAIDSCINQNMAAIIPSEKVQVRFLYFLFQAMYEDLRELGRGGNQAALNCEIIGSIRVPLPSNDEQIAIVDMLDGLLIKLNNADNLGVKQIELLQERRTALISAAVTGKIDVRHFTSKNGQAPKSSSQGAINA